MAEPVSTFREMSPDTTMFGVKLGDYLKDAMKQIGHENLFRNCGKCSYWQEGRGCSLYQALPPVRIIVVGCDSFNDTDEIPF